MKIENIDNHDVIPENKYIFDANVWIDLLSVNVGQSDPRNIQKYSKLFQDILTKNCEIAIMAIEISEIFNTYLRNCAFKYCNLQNQKYNSKNYKKYYRPSQSFQQDKNFIADEISETILRNCLKVNDKFSQLSNKYLLGKTVVDFDFNDNYMLHFCELENYIFVTHDKDCQSASYSKINVKVVTANI